MLLLEALLIEGIPEYIVFLFNFLDLLLKLGLPKLEQLF